MVVLETLRWCCWLKVLKAAGIAGPAGFCGGVTVTRSTYAMGTNPIFSPIFACSHSLDGAEISRTLSFFRNEMQVSLVAG